MRLNFFWILIRLEALVGKEYIKAFMTGFVFEREENRVRNGAMLGSKKFSFTNNDSKSNLSKGH